MRKETIKIREKLIQKLWEKKKNSLSMKDISEIFGISIANVFKIIKKGCPEKTGLTNKN